MRLNWPLSLNVIEETQLLQGVDVLWSSRYLTGRGQEVVWKASIEIISLLDICNILRTELQS